MSMEPTGIDRSPEEEEDLLSELPSDVLVSVMEKLSLPEAVRMGVLSRRWRSLPHELPRLALHWNDFKLDEVDSYYEDEGDDDGELPEGDTLAQASDAMFEATVALLASRRKEAGCTLAVSFLLRHNFMSIGGLLDDAITSGKACAIELAISSTYSRDDMDDDHDVDHANNIMLAYGRRFMTLFGDCPAAFGGLTRLTMTNMLLRGGDFDNILACCARLEMLSLYACDTGPWVPWPRIRVRHARLAELTLTSSIFMGGVDLAWLPRLERFTCRDWWVYKPMRLMSFGYVPRLATVTLSNKHSIGDETLRISEILANIAITDLRLNFKGQDIWVKPEGSKRLISMFCNLKRLKIRNLHEDCGLSWIRFLLQASPCLEELHIKLWNQECSVRHAEENDELFFPTKKTHVPWEVTPAGFKHYALARVTILGFDNNNTGGEKVVAFIRHLTEAAANLKEIRMLKNMPCKECGAAATTGFPRTGQERDSLRQRISGGETATFKICIQS